MKKAAHLFVAAVVLAIGCFVGHRYHAQERYDLAWQAGNANGWASAVKFMNETEKIENPHDWDFKQEGASIYSFDQSTGEVCWIQSRPAGTALKQCPPFPPFEK